MSGVSIGYQLFLHEACFLEILPNSKYLYKETRNTAITRGCINCRKLIEKNTNCAVIIVAGECKSDSGLPYHFKIWRKLEEWGWNNTGHINTREYGFWRSIFGTGNTV